MLIGSTKGAFSTTGLGSLVGLGNGLLQIKDTSGGLHLWIILVLETGDEFFFFFFSE